MAGPEVPAVDDVRELLGDIHAFVSGTKKPLGWPIDTRRRVSCPCPRLFTGLSSLGRCAQSRCIAWSNPAEALHRQGDITSVTWLSVGFRSGNPNWSPCIGVAEVQVKPVDPPSMFSCRDIDETVRRFRCQDHGGVSSRRTSCCRLRSDNVMASQGRMGTWRRRGDRAVERLIVSISNSSFRPGEVGHPVGASEQVVK